MNEPWLTRAQAAEESQNEGANLSPNPTMGEIIAARYSRRDLMRGALAVTAISATLSPIALATAAAGRGSTTPSFDFNEIAAGSSSSTTNTRTRS